MEWKVKRVYDAPSPDDGFRVLVDRLWPRGLSTQRAAVDLWAKDVAPTATLRVAYHHDGMAWDDFVAAYGAEVAANPAVPALRAVLVSHPVVTLLHSVADSERNHAALLARALEA